MFSGRRSPSPSHDSAVNLSAASSPSLSPPAPEERRQPPYCSSPLPPPSPEIADDYSSTRHSQYLPPPPPSIHSELPPPNAGLERFEERRHELPPHGVDHYYRRRGFHPYEMPSSADELSRGTYPPKIHAVQKSGRFLYFFPLTQTYCIAFENCSIIDCPNVIV